MPWGIFTGQFRYPIPCLSNVIKFHGPESGRVLITSAHAEEAMRAGVFKMEVPEWKAAVAEEPILGKDSQSESIVREARQNKTGNGKSGKAGSRR